jgi:hypothetical protein
MDSVLGISILTWFATDFMNMQYGRVPDQTKEREPAPFSLIPGSQRGRSNPLDTPMIVDLYQSCPIFVRSSKCIFFVLETRLRSDVWSRQAAATKVDIAFSAVLFRSLVSFFLQAAASQT